MLIGRLMMRRHTSRVSFVDSASVFQENPAKGVSRNPCRGGRLQIVDTLLLCLLRGQLDGSEIVSNERIDPVKPSGPPLDHRLEKIQLMS